MRQRIDRRVFLAGAAAGGLSLPACASESQGHASKKPTSRPGKQPMFRISLAQWSLHRRLLGRAEPELDNLDFAKTARGFGIDAIEYVNRFFRDRVGDKDYLKQMKKRAADHGVKSLLIMCDDLGSLGDPDATRRREAVARHEPWLEAARFLGCHSIRVNAQSAGSYDEQMKLAADGLSDLATQGKKYALDVIVENHGGLSSDGAWLSGVMKKVDMPNCGTLPDFGNFHIGEGRDYDRYRGVKELMPFAKAVSAKAHDFDAEGNEKHTDFLRMMKIVVSAGYRGWVGIEYEGRELDEDAGIRKTLALLQRVRRQLTAAVRPDKR